MLDWSQRQPVALAEQQRTNQEINMNNANQNTISAVRPNRFFLFAGCCALLSAFILTTNLLVSMLITVSEDVLEFWFIISMFVAVPAAIALCLVRRPLLLTGAAVASASSWGIVLGSAYLSMHNPSLTQSLNMFWGLNVLMCIASHLVWTTWAGYLLLFGKPGASS
jgi:hypothetical protein